jgi:hypothetical protein
MASTHRFNGHVILYSTRSGFAGPKDVALGFAASFGPDGRWRVAPDDFGVAGQVVVPDIVVPLFGKLKLVVTLETEATGTHDAASGAVALSARFRFRIAGSPSILPLPLDTGTHAITLPAATVNGAPLHLANGRLQLAGKASFQGGHLHGDTCLVGLDGLLTLHPSA